MPAPRRVVIVGGGLAGAKTAEALRRQGFEGEVTLIGAETHIPYQRPPLSKEYLMGKAGFDQAVVHPAEWYLQRQIDLRLNTRVTGVRVAGHEVRLDDGTPLGYDKLVLATGSTPRRLPVPGADAGGVHYLRTREDSDEIRSCFGLDRHLLIIGAGWIGLEVAAAARSEGTDVTVLERDPLPLVGVLGPEMAGVFASLHREHGVDLRSDVQVEAILTQADRAVGVRLSGGDTILADDIVVGIGVRPNLDIGGLDDLAMDGGLLVDASLRTSDPDIYAVGDIANHDHPVLGQRIRLEHWAAAMYQPRAAVAALLGGDDAYTRLPYFFTDQYDLSMGYTGWAPAGCYQQVVVRGDVESREFAAFWLDAEHRIKAAMDVNTSDLSKPIGPLIASGTPVDPARLADPGVDYADLVEAGG